MYKYVDFFTQKGYQNWDKIPGSTRKAMEFYEKLTCFLPRFNNTNSSWRVPCVITAIDKAVTNTERQSGD
ncbi:hypothetical protein KK062_16500, partial [Fulvivirgaceae bacterium PWU5]